ncbi:MAG: CHAD domain-containing protein [Thermoanaerobaculia bacterium]|nr:CHAD domain-containing protein [Thermoanaerobaculia bacterium]
MAYEFELHEPIAGAAQRILGEQVDRATAHLTSNAEPAEKRVHNARKRFKEIRALLRLVAPSLGGQFVVENRFFRDVARDLAATRDADAVIETVAKLRAAGDTPALKRLERALRLRRKSVETADLQASVANAVAQLPLVMGRVMNWPPIPERFSTIGDGLEKIYRQGRDGFARAAGDPTAENYHEWRKRVKDHWYHVQLLRRVWPPMMKAWEGVLEQLSATLGDHHDLDVLRALIPDVATETDRAAIIEIIDVRRLVIEQLANDFGTRLYSETPAAWRARMRSWWKAWRNESPSTS